MWADGAFTTASMEEMCIRNAAAQGAASILNDLITLDDEALRGSDE